MIIFMPKEELRDAQIHYMNTMKRNLKRLHEDKRRTLLNSLFEQEQSKNILKQTQNFLKLPSSA